MALWTNFPVGCEHQSSTEQPATPGKTLKCRAQSTDFERKISARFILPGEVLAHRNGTLQQSSVFLDLPHEVLLDIFEAISHAPSQIGLALTCKQMARMAQRINLGLSASSARYAGFLPPTVFDVPDLMGSLRPWMPSELKFCAHCLTYRPQDAKYWHTIDGFERYDFWVQKVGWTFKDAGWRKQTHDICPACHSSCSISDYVPCDGCRALGRLGDVDWARVSDHWRARGDSTAGFGLRQSPNTSNESAEANLTPFNQDF